jgi:hypothetical protein
VVVADDYVKVAIGPTVYIHYGLVYQPALSNRLFEYYRFRILTVINAKGVVDQWAYTSKSHDCNVR